MTNQSANNAIMTRILIGRVRNIILVRNGVKYDSTTALPVALSLQVEDSCSYKDTITLTAAIEG